MLSSARLEVLRATFLQKRVKTHAGHSRYCAANGAITSDATRQYAYDLRGRLIQTITALGVINYEVNALGLRVRKQVPYANTDTLYHYDARGHLIAEHEAASTRYREYIWLGDQPVVVMQ